MKAAILPILDVAENLIHHPAVWYLALTVSIVNVILYVLILNWAQAIINDPKCTCARDWRIKYVVYFPPLALLAGVLVAACVTGGLVSSYVAVVVTAAVFLGWVWLIRNAFTYVNDLHRTKCTCATSDMIGDEAMQVYASLKVAWWAVLAILATTAGYALSRKRLAVPS